jgi:hypothetical protein
LREGFGLARPRDARRRAAAAAGRRIRNRAAAPAHATMARILKAAAID